MFALGRNNPEAAGSRYIKVALLINLHAVECVFTLSRRHVEKDFSVRQSAIGVHFVSHDDLLLSVPIVDVEVLLIWREGQTVRSLQIGGQQLDLLAIWRDAEYTRSEEHTSELQSRQYLVCRLLLEKKKKKRMQLDVYIKDLRFLPLPDSKKIRESIMFEFAVQRRDLLKAGQYATIALSSRWCQRIY